MDAIIYINEHYQIKTQQIFVGQTNTIKEKHLFVGFIWSWAFLYPQSSNAYFFLNLRSVIGLDIKPIEVFMITTNYNNIKPQLNEFRQANINYDFFLLK